MEDKIDPVFRMLINKKKINDTALHRGCSSHLKVKPSKESASKNRIAQELYDCIVYTKDAKTLRDSGIIINSVLPSFVTAQATLDQIIQMASMPGVTYVDAPKTDHLHKKK